MTNYGIKAGMLIEIDEKIEIKGSRAIVLCLSDIDNVTWWYEPMTFLWNGKIYKDVRTHHLNPTIIAE